MIQFKEINGQLCLMLEKPDAINEFSKTPCVIACKCGGLKKYYILDFPPSNPSMSMLAEGFEILGYPVVPNSAEWALWRMMQGDKVTKRNFKHTYWHYDARPHLKCISEYNCGKLQIMVSPDIWIKTAYREGWQIYAEKPLLAEAREGDLCQRSNGRYTQFHSKHKLNDGTIAYYFDDVSGSTNIDGDHCSHECGNNIVSCEPLAPIGSAEWALQMMKLGKDVCRKGHETAYYHICNDGKEIACSLKNERRLTCGHLLVSKWGETGNDWQLYEPKPEHPAINGYNRYDYVPVEGIKQPKPLAAKVGDWVRTANGDGKVIEIPLTMPEVALTNGQRGSFHADGISVISPAEVRIKITLEGTVEKCSMNTFRIETNNGKYWVSWKDLNPQDHHLVESLLNAQEES